MQPMIHQELARLRAEELLRRAAGARRRSTPVARAEPGRVRRSLGRGLVRAGMRLLGEPRTLTESAAS